MCALSGVHVFLQAWCFSILGSNMLKFFINQALEYAYLKTFKKQISHLTTPWGMEF